MDPDGPDAGSSLYGVKPGARTLVRPQAAPEYYDRAAQTPPEIISGFLKSMPPNQWNLMPRPAARGSSRAWGTIPYDRKRHQFIWWGGGHSAYKASDTSHYSLRTASWSSGYRSEEPLRGSFFVDAVRFFPSGRPQIPCHVWNSAAYDPPSGKVLFHSNGYTWVYNPVRRDWDLPGIKPPFEASPVHMGMTDTPGGAVAVRKGALYLYNDTARTWKTLAKSGMPHDASGDGGGICYDSKRDGLWFMRKAGKKPQPPYLHRYDMKTGKLTPVNTELSPGFCREIVYHPELDMLFSMTRQKGVDGTAVNIAFDIEKGKWIGLAIPFSDGRKNMPTHYWYYTRAIAYDPEYKLVLFHNANEKEIWGLRLQKDVKVVDIDLEGRIVFDGGKLQGYGKD
jgi:hypothetical protein